MAVIAKQSSESYVRGNVCLFLHGIQLIIKRVSPHMWKSSKNSDLQDASMFPNVPSVEASVVEGRKAPFRVHKSACLHAAFG